MVKKIELKTKKKWKKDDPDYEYIRKIHLIDLTKKRYANDESFINKCAYIIIKDIKNIYHNNKSKIKLSSDKEFIKLIGLQLTNYSNQKI